MISISAVHVHLYLWCTILSMSINSMSIHFDMSKTSFCSVVYIGEIACQRTVVKRDSIWWKSSALEWKETLSFANKPWPKKSVVICLSHWRFSNSHQMYLDQMATSGEHGIAVTEWDQFLIPKMKYLKRFQSIFRTFFVIVAYMNWVQTWDLKLSDPII